MTTRPIDKLVAALRRATPAIDPPLAVARKDFESVLAHVPLAPAVDVRPAVVGGVKAEWLVPAGANEARVVLYLHGGGYVMGSVGTIRSMASYLAASLKCPVLTLDYRLAPEHPHPAAIEDVCLAYRELLGRFAPSDLVLAGDSAGGGLTVATLVALRDSGDPLPAAAFALSPWLDLTLSGESVDANVAGDPGMTRTKLAAMAAEYVGSDPAKATSASPLFADLHGLPPLLVQVGGAEILLDDSRRFAARCKEAGVAVTLSVWDDMIHDWHMYAPRLPEAQAAMGAIAEWLARTVWS